MKKFILILITLCLFGCNNPHKSIRDDALIESITLCTRCSKRYILSTEGSMGIRVLTDNECKIGQTLKECLSGGQNESPVPSR